MNVWRLVPVLLAPLAAVSLPAQGQSVAVLAVDTSASGAASGDPLPAAEAMRRHLEASGATMLAADETRQRLMSIGVGAGADIEVYRARLQAAEDAFAALDTERSIEILEGGLRDLASDADFSTEKQELLERSRVRAAARLMALAGPAEAGAAETPLGLRALGHLVAASRTNPTLTLSKREHPPKMHRLLALAQAELEQVGVGGLSVDSVPEGATVYVEGRPVGQTPLRLSGTLPSGRYRVWVALDSARSATRWVEVSEQGAQLEVDLAFEGALWGGGPGLRPVRGQTITEAVAAKVAGLLGVDQLVLVGFASYDEADWLYGAVYSSPTGTTARRGAVRLSSAAPTDEDSARLAGFLWRGEEESIDSRPVPSLVLPGQQSAEVAAATLAEDSDVLLWAGVGAGAGAALLAVVGAGALTALLVSGAEPRAGVFALEVAP